MIRARVSYEVNAAVITSPDTTTNEKNITVEGNASPTTTIVLQNNGEEVGSMVVGADGEFAIPAELIEGLNEFKVTSSVEGREVGESTPVTVTLDTKKPELTITNPVNGDKTNRETLL